jgi:succinoglycan biosynthesis transport protein ExoP
MSQDNPLLPMSAVERGLDRPLRDLAQSKPYGVSHTEPTHLRDYLFIVLKRKWLILSIVFVVTCLVAIREYRQPNIYSAAATIQIDQKPKSILQTKEVVINTENDPAYWNTQLKLLENPVLARQVVLTLDLPNNPDFFGGPARSGLLPSLRRIFSRDKGATTAQPAPDAGLPTVIDNKDVTEEKLTPQQLSRLEPYEDAIAAGLAVEPVSGTNLVKLRYTHTNPELAQKVANTLADVFMTNNLKRMTQGSDKSADLLAKEIADLQLKVRRGEEERVNYAKAKNLPLTEKIDVESSKLSQLATQLLIAENERKAAQADYEAAKNASDVYAIPQVQNDERIRKLRDQIEALEQKKAALEVTYTKEWPEVKKIDEQIKPLKEALDKAPREVVAALESRYKSAQSKENYLRQSYNQQRGTTSQQNQDQIQLTMMTQTLETDKQYLNTLLQRQRETLATGNDNPNNVTVAEYSRVPRAPIGPPRTRNVSIAFLLALVAGIGLAFLLDFLDDTLKTVEDVDRYIHLPALALIPSNRAERLSLKGKALGSDGNETTALALIDDVRSPVAEAYRHLRTSLLLSSAGQPPKTILVTSSQPSEGKTTTAVNTAVMLAQTGAEVLIIDCDLRRPRLHAHFNVPNTRGVTNYLSGEAEIDELLQPYEKTPNLKLLTSGPVPPNPAELLGSDEMRKLLNLLGERFNHIIIDSPPCISFTDASILSTLCDGVMLVVHGGRSSRAVVRRAKQQLVDVGAHLFGVVLNNVKLEAQDYYYYAGYYSSYYSSPEDDAPQAAPGASANPRS